MYDHVMRDAVPMTKAEIIRRREEAIGMRWAMIDNDLLSDARRAKIVASGRQMGKQAMTRIFLEYVTK